jgi:hypothetical protein
VMMEVLLCLIAVASGRGRRTRATTARGTTAMACGTLADGAWWPINKLGRFGRTGASMGVWVVGPNRDGVGVGTRWLVRGGLRRNNID